MNPKFRVNLPEELPCRFHAGSHIVAFLHFLHSNGMRVASHCYCLAFKGAESLTVRSTADCRCA